jgi:hypothetical protein
MARTADAATCIQSVIKAAHTIEIPVLTKDANWSKQGDLPVWSGCPPTWFVEACMFAALNEQESKNALPLGFSSVAQLLYEHNPRILAGILQQLFAPVEAKGLTPNSVHRELALLAFDLFVTTNFDNCLEKARGEIYADLCPISNDEHLRDRGVCGARLFKIHGEFLGFSLSTHAGDDEARRFIDQVVLSDSQYWGFPHGQAFGSVMSDASHNQLSHRSMLTEHVRSLMNVHRLLFLGYSLSDFNILGLVHSLSPQMNSDRRPILVTTDDRRDYINTWRNRGFYVHQVNRITEFIADLWHTLYGNIPFNVASTPILAHRDKRTFIPAAILKREADSSAVFSGVLARLVKDRLFPVVKKEKHFLANLPRHYPFSDCIWPNNLFAQFLAQGWVRQIRDRINSSDDDDLDYYEFHPDVRSGIIDMLGFDLNRRRV